MTGTVKVINCPTIKDYEIVTKIGEGGIAEIFKARQISLNRPVAIKMLFPNLSDNEEIVKRFNRESTVIANLNHPNIVHVIDKGKVEGRYYFIMEYVDGTSFADIIYSEKFSVRQKLDIIVMVLKGLDYAHKNGVIHRDIKPANILIDKQGNALLADFGIAHIPQKTESDMTCSDIVMGTMAYMPPEQKMSAALVDNTSDIYSVGVMVYEILLGRRPGGRFKLPTEVNPKIPQSFDDIISKCLAQEQIDRYQKAVELKDDLLEVMNKSEKRKTNPQSTAGVTSFIGKCDFLDALKETRYSSTMLVENRESHELYVIKKTSRGSAGLKEARQLCGLNHDNIIKIYGAGGDNLRLIVVMEYANGGSLADRMVQTYSFDDAMKITLAVAEALDFVHKKGIIHGNIRPSNILFTSDEVVKVTDFGLPPHYNLMAKNWYAPPEKRVSVQADIYGLGVILFRLLFGKNPVYDRSSNLFLGHLGQSLPTGMSQILDKMLAIRVAKRYKTIDEFLVDWDAVLLDIERSKRKERPLPVNKNVRKKVNYFKIMAIIGASLLT
ncbi:MAG: serine/threonine-protein kinase, partial [Candidatus Zixiibacteriota bacterium]